MDTKIKLFLIITGVLQGNGVSLRRQLEHIVEKKLESQGIPLEMVPSRRTFYKYDPRELSGVLGAPDMPSHLPEAEPILPAHTLLKPALGMLKSSVKFPHIDFEDGAGVYGNIDNIGIRYDSKNKRVLYSGFRRMQPDYIVNQDPTRAGNKLSLYLNENKVPSSEQKRNGQIYLKRIYNSKPLVKNVRAEKPKFENQLTNQVQLRFRRAVDENEDSPKERPSKKTFDHIVINQNAPDFFEIFPSSLIEQQRPWFYNEGDTYNNN